MLHYPAQSFPASDAVSQSQLTAKALPLLAIGLKFILPVKSSVANFRSSFSRFTFPSPALNLGFSDSIAKQ